MKEKASRKVFVRAGEPVGIIGGSDSRLQRLDNALVVMPDECWGNPLFGDASLAEGDFHIHATITLEKLAATGASVLLGGHYHYLHSRPDGHMTFRICLDEDISPRIKSLGKKMYIVHGRTQISDAAPSPAVKPWYTWYATPDREIAGESLVYFRPREPFAIDIYGRGDNLTFEINGRVVFNIVLSDGLRLPPGPGCENGGWPINIGFLPGRAALRIHDFWVEGVFTGPAYPTEDVWCFNRDGYNTYRLPSICATASGKLLAFAEAKKHRLSRLWEWELDQVQGELNCAMKSSSDGGITWSEQEVLIDKGISYEARNPSPLLDQETGEIFLFLNGDPWLITSHDEGITWSAPRSLLDAAPGEFNNFAVGAANCAIQLRYGSWRNRLLLAMNARNTIILIYSDDHGKSWKPGAITPVNGAGEPTIVELSDGRVVVSPRMRESVPGRPFLYSHDGGLSFKSQRFETALPMVGRGGEMLACEPFDAGSAGQIRPIVCCGPVRNKTGLVIQASLDDGDTWPYSLLIDDGFCGNLALANLPGGEVGVLYEADKFRRIILQRVSLASLLEN